jgi:hypothetical protein
MEAALIAVSDKKRPLRKDEILAMLSEINLKPQLQSIKD